MANEDIEQKIRLSFENNADENAKEVDKLTASIDKTTESQDKTVKENTKVENSFKSLKVQLREATLEQQKLSAQYGSTSKEAITATKAVAKLKDEIGFQKDLVSSYNPDEKFRGLTQTAGIAAIALSGVSDGFKALGIESKALDQVIGTAQAVLGVTSAVAAMSDAYAILTATKKAKAAADVVEATTTEVVAVANVKATATTWSWNAALLANPIVLITAGIIAAGAAIYAFAKITSNAVSEEEKAKVASMQLSKAIDNQAKSFENNNNFLSKNNDFKISMLRASGASEKQIYAETKALGEQELQLAKNYRAEALLAEQKAYEANRANPTEFNAKTLKDAKENITKAEKAVSVGYDGLIVLQQSHEIAVMQAQTDARKKAAEEAKKAREKAIEDRKKDQEKEIADKKAYLEKANAVEDEFALIKSDKEKADKEKKREEYEQGLSEQAQKAADQKSYLDNLANEQKIRDEEALQFQIDKDNAIAASQQNLNNIISNLETAGIAKSKAGQAIMKGIALTQIGIDSAVAISKASSLANAEGVAAQLAFPLVPGIGTVARVVSYASTAASVIGNIARAKRLLSGGGGGGSSSGGGQTSTPRGTQGSSATPQVNFQASSENQIGNTVAGRLNAQPPIRVTVLESDITKTQGQVQAKVVSNSF
jgi:hypothetical protein